MRETLRRTATMMLREGLADFSESPTVVYTLHKRDDGYMEVKKHVADKVPSLETIVFPETDLKAWQ